MSTVDVVYSCFNIIFDTVVLFSSWFVLFGILIGIIQTVFSIQDQSLPIVVKLLVLIFLLSRESHHIYEQLSFLIDNI